MRAILSPFGNRRICFCKGKFCLCIFFFFSNQKEKGGKKKEKNCLWQRAKKLHTYANTQHASHTLHFALTHTHTNKPQQQQQQGGAMEATYIKKALGSALTDALSLVSTYRPEDPIEWLANYLRHEATLQETRAIRQKEQEERGKLLKAAQEEEERLAELKVLVVLCCVVCCVSRVLCCGCGCVCVHILCSNELLRCCDFVARGGAFGKPAEAKHCPVGLHGLFATGAAKYPCAFPPSLHLPVLIAFW